MGRTACTEPQYSYTSTPPMGRTVCTEPQYSYNSTHPMGRTVCTEPQYSYNSTPPMGRTVCTEPQCLYKGAPYLYLLLTIKDPWVNQCDIMQCVRAVNQLRYCLWFITQEGRLVGWHR